MRWRAARLLAALSMLAAACLGAGPKAAPASPYSFFTAVADPATARTAATVEAAVREAGIG